MKIKNDYKLKNLIELGFRKFDHMYFYVHYTTNEVVIVDCETRKISIAIRPYIYTHFRNKEPIVKDLLFVIAKLAEKGIIEYE